MTRPVPHRWYAQLFVWVLGAVALGCGGQPPPPPPCDASENLSVHFSPSQQLNPDREGYARSVVARIYQLDSDRAVTALEFDELWQRNADDAPASPVLAVAEELTLIPGRPEVRALKRHAKATHLLIVAKFREHAPRSAWRASIALPAPTDPCATPSPPGPRLQVEVANYSLHIR